MVAGKIVSINEEKDLWYLACSSCKKKVQGEKCDKCWEARGVVLTYTFDLRITDGTETAWVHLFGDQGQLLFRMPAEELQRLKSASLEEYRKVFTYAKSPVCGQEYD